MIRAVSSREKTGLELYRFVNGARSSGLCRLGRLQRTGEKERGRGRERENLTLFEFEFIFYFTTVTNKAE